MTALGAFPAAHVIATWMDGRANHCCRSEVAVQTALLGHAATSFGGREVQQALLQAWLHHHDAQYVILLA